MHIFTLKNSVQCFAAGVLKLMADARAWLVQPAVVLPMCSLRSAADDNAGLLQLLLAAHSTHTCVENSASAYASSIVTLLSSAIMLKKMLLKCAATRPDGSSDQNMTLGTPFVRSSSATAQRATAEATRQHDSSNSYSEVCSEDCGTAYRVCKMG
jgi:hypothetical protein